MQVGAWCAGGNLTRGTPDMLRAGGQSKHARFRIGAAALVVYDSSQADQGPVLATLAHPTSVGRRMFSSIDRNLGSSRIESQAAD